MNTDFQRLAQTIADSFAAVEPYASTLDGFSIYRADDYSGKVVDSRSNAIWYNSILIAAAGVCDYNQIIVIARNSGWAGGAPGYYSVVGSGTPPTCNPNTCTGIDCPWTPSCSWDENIAATALHETGHTFVGLRHTCDPATQQLEIQRLEEIERIDFGGEPAATLDEPINCGVQFTGNPNAPCAEWNLPAFWNWVLPGDPTFGCYSVCDGRTDWYRAWNSVPNIMCIDYYFENGFTPVDRKLLWNVISIPDLQPYAPPGYTFPVVPTSRQGTTTPNTLFADTRTFFDWHFLNAGNGAAEGSFYTELWVDNIRYARYPETYMDSGQVFSHDDWAETIFFPGWHTVKAIADPDNTIAESNETNNVWEQQFYWQSISGWKGEYYANPNLDSNPWLTRDDASIDFEWFSDAPDPTLPVDGFSAKWTRSVEFTSGFYLFTIFHDDGARFYVDDALVLDNWCDDCRQTDTVIVELASGIHELRLEVFENIGWAAARLSWQPVNLPTVQFSSTSYSVNENGGSASINVTLSSASSTAVTVNYATSNGSATAGSDYTAASGTLTFDPGQTSKTFTVAILNDSLDEADETVNLALSSPSNATLGSPNNAVLTIVDDDAPPGNAVLSLVPSSTTVGVGQTFSVEMRVRTTQPADGASAYLNFDPALLQVVSITPGTALDTPLQNSFDNALGRVDYTAVTFGSAPGSDFTLATVLFRATARSTGTPVVFASTLPRQSDVTYNGASILHHVENGNVIILDAASVRGHVIPPGRPAPPHVRWRVPVTVTLTTNVGGTPLYTFTPTTDDSGYFTVTGITPGAYRMGVKGSNTLRQTSEVTLNAGFNTVEFDPLPPGDANNDNFVTLVDFSILRTTFGKCAGTAGYDRRADFNGDDCVTLVDFSLMRTTFGSGGDERLAAAVQAPQAANVALALEPRQSQLRLGEKLTLSVRVEAGDQPVDGAAVYLTLDPNVLEIISVTVGAELPFILQESFDPATGRVNVAAGVLETPVVGDVTLATIRLRAVGVGSTSVRFQHDAAQQTDVAFGGVSVLAGAADGVVSVVEAMEPVDAAPSGGHTIYLPIIEHR